MLVDVWGEVPRSFHAFKLIHAFFTRKRKVTGTRVIFTPKKCIMDELGI